MAIFDFSGKWGEPEDQGLLRKTQVIDPVKDPWQDPGFGVGGGTRDFCTVDENYEILTQTARNTMSVVKTAIGTSEVTRNTPFPLDERGNPRVSPMATPLSRASVEPFVSVNKYVWFTTLNPNSQTSLIHWDPVTSKIWATDFDHDVAFAGNPDRVLIGDPFQSTPEISLFLPTGFTNLDADVGDTLILDLGYRLAFIQGRSNDGLQTATLIYKLDDPASPPVNLYTMLGPTFSARILGHSTDFLVIRVDSQIRRYARDGDGLPTTNIGAYSGTTGIGFRHLMVDNDGHFWGCDSNATKDWNKLPMDSLTAQVIDAGTNGISERFYDFNPLDNFIYFMNGDENRIFKISCDTNTVTEVTSSAFGALSEADRAITIVDLTTFKFSPDYDFILVIRGGDNITGYPQIFQIDKFDGSIEMTHELEAPLSTTNYELDTPAVFGNYVVTMGDNYLQIINYLFGDEGSDPVFDPVEIAARMISPTTALVQTWHFFNPGKILVDCGYHFEFVREG